MSFSIRSAAREKMFVVAHRGTPGGNIPCNTIPSYEIALKQGADMIEVDLNMTADGKLIIFHPGMEKAHPQVRLTSYIICSGWNTSSNRSAVR